MSPDDLEWVTVPDRWADQRLQLLERDPDWHLHMTEPED